MFRGYTTNKEYAETVQKQFDAIANGASPFLQPLLECRRISITQNPVRPRFRLLPFQLA